MEDQLHRSNWWKANLLIWTKVLLSLNLPQAAPLSLCSCANNSKVFFCLPTGFPDLENKSFNLNTGHSFCYMARWNARKYGTFHCGPKKISWCTATWRLGRKKSVCRRWYCLVWCITSRKKVLVDQSPLPETFERIYQADTVAIVRYGLDRQVKEAWYGVLGAQFQYNKRWMFRTEWGLIGDRKSDLTSVNYRILLRGVNWCSLRVFPFIN